VVGVVNLPPRRIAGFESEVHSTTRRASSCCSRTTTLRSVTESARPSRRRAR
jgi:hypothetical protein